MNAPSDVEEFTKEDADRAEEDLSVEANEAVNAVEEREFDVRDDDDHDEEDPHGSHPINEPNNAG